MIFQIYVLLAPLVAKASTARYGAGKAESRNLNMENSLPKNRQATEEAVLIAKKVTKKASRSSNQNTCFLGCFVNSLKITQTHKTVFPKKAGILTTFVISAFERQEEYRS